jgi:ornithine cyclodeaminase/alanine dehydrogenase-like protein (mu-crystallin family)
MALLLSHEDVRQCVGMADAIRAIEEMCRAQGEGTAVSSERVNLPLPNGWIRLMAGTLGAHGVFGYKEFHLTRVAAAEAEVLYSYHLFDSASGRPLALMDADYLTFIRTAAASGVAIKHLSRADAAAVGIIGSGAEARSHLEAAVAVRPVKSAKVYSRSAERRRSFARDMAEQLGLDITPVERIEQAIEDVDILLVATNTSGTGPALFGRSLKATAKKGLHINSIGSTLPQQREIDPDVWDFADRIVVDTHRLLREGGDGIAAVAAGVVDEARAIELFQVITGRSPGRETPDQVTLYKSIGTGLQDVAVAHAAFREAQKRRLGCELPSYQSVKLVEPN